MIDLVKNASFKIFGKGFTYLIKYICRLKNLQFNTKSKRIHKSHVFKLFIALNMILIRKVLQYNQLFQNFKTVF